MATSVSYIISGPEDDFRLPNESIGKYLYDCLKKRPFDGVVNVNATSGEVLTCGQLLEDSVKLCTALKTLGIKKGDVIAILSENSINYCVPLLASLYMGVAANLLNPAYSIGELKHAFLLSKAKLIFCSESSLENVLKVKEELKFIKNLILIGLRPENKHCDVKTLQNLLETTTVSTESFQLDTFDCSTEGVFILLSSGTTGLPKGVLITHENFRSPLSYLTNPKYGNIKSKDVTVLALPFYHIFGLLIQMMSITTGMKLILLENFKPDTFLRLVQEQKATKLFLVPPLLSFLTKHPVVNNYDISSVTDFLVGGAPVPEGLIKDARKRFNWATVRQLYGLTEVSGACTFQTADMKDAKSAGSLVPYMIAKVWDNDMKKNLGPLKIGELCFKGPMIMKGYIGDATATQNCIDGDGFLHTGDVGFYNEEGHFYIVDRLKELIKYKGFQVPPAELEALILTHPGVSDCGVIGIPDERSGQIPLAYVVQKNGTNVTKQEIVDFVAERISAQKHLYGGVVFVDEIPKNGTGKILRRKLMEMFKISQ